MINDKLHLAFEVDLLIKNKLGYLRVDNFNIPTFYVIPKIHKDQVDPPGRPIVSAIRGTLEWVSKDIDFLVKDLVCTFLCTRYR